MSITPIFIVCRDRITHLKQLVSWLEAAGEERIYLIDNGSTYEPLLSYLDANPHNVQYMRENVGHLVLWKRDLLSQYHIREQFVLTDPDVVPTAECPHDAIDYFKRVQRQYDVMKAGFGLVTDDLPAHNRERIVAWESQFVNVPLRRIVGSADLFSADIDTTFAVYSDRCPFDSSPGTGNSIRTVNPYLARHMSWYIDPQNLSEEDLYYAQHADTEISHWARNVRVLREGLQG